MSNAIPIKNIYYLLLYAWDRLQEGRLVEVGGLESTTMADLLTGVLCRGTRHLFRQGLDRGYVPKQEDTSCLRGRIDMATTTKRLLHFRASAHCQFDELSFDVVHNQILKATLYRLARVRGLNSGLRVQAIGLLRLLREVSDIRLNRFAFRRLQLYRNHGFYDFLMKVCDLVQQNLLMEESGGGYRFRDFERDEKAMASVFERFVMNFLRREQSVLHVSSDQLGWDAEADDPTMLEKLPQMRTDISLRSADRTVVIDTKYYKDSLQSHFGKQTIHSGHLYQIGAYLRNMERNEGADSNAEGILLYPTVSQRLDLRYRIHGHVVRVCTLDLNQPWEMIRGDLLGLVLHC